MEDEDIFTVHKNDLADAIKVNKVKDSSFVFDNLVNTKEKFLKSWLIPFESSWHKRFV